MSGPWERYQSAPAGPWERYGEQPAQEPLRGGRTMSKDVVSADEVAARRERESALETSDTITRGIGAAYAQAQRVRSVLPNTVNTLLDTVAGVEAVRARARTGAAASDFARDDGFLDRSGSIVERSVGSAAGAIERVAGTIAPGRAGEVMRARAATLEQTGNAEIDGETTWEDVKASPLRNIAPFLYETMLGSAVEMGITALPVIGLATQATIQTGRIGQQRALNEGNRDASLGDLAVAAPFGIGAAVLERAGIDRIFGASGSTVARRVGQAAAAEGVTEAGQSSLEYTGGTVGTERGWSATEMLDQAAGGFVGGVGMGGTLRGAYEGGEAVSQRFNRPSIALSSGDRASPLPDDLLAQGRAAIAETTGGPVARTDVAAGQRVSVTMPNGQARTGTVAAVTADGEPAVRVQFDDGQVLDQPFSMLADAGVDLQPIADDTPSLDQLAAQAQERLAAAQAGQSVIAPPQRTVAPEAAEQAVSVGQFDMARYMARNRRAESSGNDNAAAQTSSAFGRYQFTEGTWLTYYRRVYGDTGETRAQILAKRADGATQDRLMVALTRDNLRAVQRAGAAATEGNVYLAHFLGPAGARAVLQADPNTPVAQLVPAAAIEANQSVLAGKTAGQVVGWAARKMGGAAPDYAADLNLPDYQAPEPTQFADIQWDDIERAGQGQPIPLRMEEAEDVAVTTTNREVPVRYAVAELSDLTVSNDQDGRINPDFPADRQPRDRSRAASQAQVAEIAGRLNPRLLARSPKASDGAPIIAPDGVVESGNGRTLALQQAYAENGERAQSYRDMLAREGFNIEGMSQPVLVRVRDGSMGEDDVRQFIREANQRETAAMSPTENASADAQAITPDMLGLYSAGDIDAASNRRFVQSFVGANIPTAEQGTYLRKSGAPAAQLSQRIEAALLVRAYGWHPFVETIVEASSSNIRTIGGALTDVAVDFARLKDAVAEGAVAPEMDISPNLAEAVEIINQARQDEKPVALYVRHVDAFRGAQLNPVTEAALRLFFSNADFTKPVGRKRLADSLRAFVREAMSGGATDSLFGDSTRASVDDIMGTIRTTRDVSQPDDEAPLDDIADPATEGQADPVGGAGQGVQAPVNDRADAGGTPVQAADGRGDRGDQPERVAPEASAPQLRNPQLTVETPAPASPKNEVGNSAQVVETITGKSVAIIGATEAQLAAVAAAIPNAKPLKRKDGATVYSKKYEAKIRAALEPQADAPAPPPRAGDDSPEAVARRLEQNDEFAKALTGDPTADPYRNKPSGIYEGFVGDAINDDWTAFSQESGTLGIPRADMPQVKSAHRGALIQFLKARGIDSEEDQVTPASLRPTQAEFSPDKVKQARDYDYGDRAILVSQDGYLVDGHHQWMGKLWRQASEEDRSQDVRVIRLQAPIRTVLTAIEEFPSASKAGGATEAPAPSDGAGLVGVNAFGQEVRQDERGVRSVSANGIRRTEPVGIVPQRGANGGVVMGMSVDSANRDPEFLTAAEWRARVEKQTDELLRKATNSQKALDLFGGGVPGWQTAGLKGRDRIIEKVLGEQYRDGPSALKDIVRGAAVVDTMAEAESVAAMVTGRYKVVENKGWKTAQTGYVDHKIIVEIDGVKAEVQIVPRAVWDARKSKGSALYRQYRVAGTQEAKDRLTTEQVALYREAVADTDFAKVGNAPKSASGNSRPASGLDSGTPSLSASAGAESQSNSPLAPPRDAQTNATGGTSENTATSRPSTSNNLGADIAATSDPQVGAAGEESNNPPATPSPNRLVTDERAAELRARLKEKLAPNRLNAGIDPEVMAIGAELAVYHIEKGARRFQAFASALSADLGMQVRDLRQYLRGWYNGARDMMEDMGESVAGMDTPDEVGRAMRTLDQWADEAPATPMQGEVLPPEAQLPAVAGSQETPREFASLRIGKSTFPFTTPAEMSKIYRDTIVEMDIGGSQTPRAIILDSNGEKAGEISYNGKVWRRRGEWQSGDVPIYDPYKVTRAANPAIPSGDGVQGSLSDGPAGAGTGTVPVSSEDRRAGGARQREDARGVPDARPADGERAEVGQRGSAEPAGAARGGADRDSAADRVSRPAGLTPTNWRIEPESLREGRKPMEKAQDNLRAIEIVKQIQAEGRAATSAEQAQIALYVGWGGLANAFPRTDGTWANPGMQRVGERLRDLLTPEEYETARRSTQYAHYTAEQVVRPMWELARRLGFTGGTVFEPGMGTGNFAGMMPADLAAVTSYRGMEFDGLTAQIAKALYPAWGVQQADYTKTPQILDQFDLAIGNPPFSRTVVSGDPTYGKLRFLLHDFFFAKTLDAIRPGGLLMFVTSAGTMNKVDAKAREYLADRADFVGAVRLPSTAFAANAGTEVTTDIIVLRKRPLGAAAGSRTWTETVEVDLPNREGQTVRAAVNRYFIDNPDMILGEQGMFDKLVAGERYGVRARPGVDLGQALSEALDKMRVEATLAPMPTFVERAVQAVDFAATERKEGSFYEGPDGDLYRLQGGVGVKVQSVGKGVTGGVSKDAQVKIRQLVKIRDALRATLAGDMSGDAEAAAKARADLNRFYDEFVAKHGPINKAELTLQRPSVIEQETARAKAREAARANGDPWEEGTFDATPFYEANASVNEIAAARRAAREAAKAAGRTFDEGSFNPDDMDDKARTKRPNIDAFMSDQEGYRLRSIEHYNEDTGQARKGIVFERNPVSALAEPTINSPEDALLYVMAMRGQPDLPEIAKLARMPEADALAALRGYLFKVPGTNRYQSREAYLSGNVREKLERAREARESDPDMQHNIEALEAVQPEPLGRDQIVAALGMPWVPTAVVEEFGRSLGLSSLTVRYNAKLARYVVDGDFSSSAARDEWGTEKREAPLLIADALNRNSPKIYEKSRGADGKTVSTLDEAATQAAQDKILAIKQRFREWVWEDDARATDLEAIYNRDYNNLVAPKFDGSYLRTPGINANWRWRPHQSAVVARIVQTGNTYMAHGVGAGKTSAMIGAGMEMRRLGLVKKPLYTVPNHMLGQFTKEFYEQYPTAKIMVADETRFHGSRRKQFVADLANSDVDAVIMSHSSFALLPVSADFENELLEEQVADLRDTLEQIDAEDRTNRVTVKQLEQQIEQLEQRQQQLKNRKKDAVYTLEETGVDFMFVDEAHNFRKLGFSTKMGQVKGIDPNGSQMSFDLFAKIRLLESRRPGRSVVLASGTPITNTMAELYTVQRYMALDTLRQKSIDRFDAWAGAFGDTETRLEQDAAGGYKAVTRFAKFVNVPELSTMVRQFMDVVTSQELEALVVRPRLKGGKRNMVVVEQTPQQKAYQAVLQDRMKKIEERTGPPEKGDDILLSVIGDGRKAAIDMRLLDRTNKREDSKLERLIDNVYRIWSESKRQPFHGIEQDGYSAKPVDFGPATQMVFADLGVNPSEARDGREAGISVHQYIRDQLLQRGVPKREIALISEFKNIVQKQRLFNDMNEGRVRILIGSVPKMGTGVNAQKRLLANHNLDPQWFPANDEQRNGRIIRQGNMNPEVEVYDYSTKGTYDSTMWGLMENKARFIEGFMRGDPTMRDMEDLGEASQYEQAKALSTADPRMIVLTELRQNLEREYLRKSAFDRQQASIRNRRATARRNLSDYRNRIAEIEADIAQRVVVKGDAFEGKAGDITFTERAPFGEALLQRMDAMKEEKRVTGKPVGVGKMGGFDLAAQVRAFAGEVDVDLYIVRNGGRLDEVEATNSALGLVQSIASRLSRFEAGLEYARQELASAELTLTETEGKGDDTYPNVEKLADLQRQVDDLETELMGESADGAAIEGREAAAMISLLERPDEDPFLPPRTEGALIEDVPQPERTMTERQRSEMETRAQQQRSGRLDQQGLGDQDGGLFSSERDQGSLFSRPDLPTVSVRVGDWGKLLRGAAGLSVLRNRVARWYNQLIGTTVTSSDGRTVRFLPVGRDKTTRAGDRILMRAKAIPAIIERGVYLGSEPARRSGYRAAHRYAANVRDETGAIVPLVAIVLEAADGNFHYSLHNLVEKDARDGSASRADGASLAAGVPAVEGTARDVADMRSRMGAVNTDELRERLRALGLADKVALRVVDTLNGAAGDFGSDGIALMRVARDTIQDGLFTLDHESIHAMRNLGLFTTTEWNLLANAARGDEGMMASVRRRYPELSEEAQVEEAVADRFARWSQGDREAGMIARLFRRIADILGAIRSALRGTGFDTADTVTRRASGGRVGRRGTPASTVRPNKALVESEAFRRWFGNSKAVDDRGRPLVVFHGTNSNIVRFDPERMGAATGAPSARMGFFFSSNPAVASSYAETMSEADKDPVFRWINRLSLGTLRAIDAGVSAVGILRSQWQRPSGANVLPVFVSLQNPMIFDFKGETYRERTYADLLREAKEKGHDGAILRNTFDPGFEGADDVPSDVFVAFSPEQIKSAISNTGAFDPASPYISQSRVSQDIDVTEYAAGDVKGKLGQALDRWRVKLQDRYLPVLRVQQRVESATGAALPTSANPYLREELMTGRIGAAIEKLSSDLVDPLLSAMSQSKVSVDELETYLYARHAPERNAQIARINPTMADGGSGMSDIEAAALINRMERAGKLPDLKALASMVDDIRDFAMKKRVDSGLLSDADAKAWRETYQDYVPLRGRLEVEGDASGLVERINRSGGGINVRGNEARRAFGRRSKADNILAYSILQAEEAIVRGETNRVAQAFVSLARRAPDAEFWEIDKVTRKPVIDSNTGLVRYEEQTRLQPEDRDWTVTAKFGGEEVRVTMNRANPSARRLADSMRHLTQHNIDWLVHYLGIPTRFLSAVNTSWNPEFIITNAFRDLQSAMINLAGLDTEKLVAGTARDYRKALVASTKGAFGKGQGEWARWYREMTEEGGRVFFNRIDDVESLKSRIVDGLERADGKLSVKRGLYAVRDFVEAANSGVENAVRLAAYKNARELGLPKDQAASIAKNVTVNFNRRGELGPLMNAFYMFFNASVQGSTRILVAMKSKRVQKILAGVVVGSFMLELLNAMISDDDEDGESYYDKISAFDKNRNLIIMLPGEGGRHIRIPMPYGYNAFASMGRTTAEIIRRGGDRGLESAGDFATAVVDAFNPVGGTESLMNFLLPTVIDPIYDLYANRDFAGRPIMPDENRFGPAEPDSQRYFSSVGPQWRAITDALNSMTGGDDIVAGTIDVSPETLEHLAGTILGAAGGFFDRQVSLGAKILDGDPNTEVEANDLPMVRKVYSSKPSWYDRSAYFDRISQVEQAVSDGRDYLERGDVERFESYVDSNRQLLTLEPVMREARREMRALRAARGEIELAWRSERMDDATYRAQRQRFLDAEKIVVQAFNTHWNRTMHPRVEE
jgi:N12 class adenine-specific DNA methylase